MKKSKQHALIVITHQKLTTVNYNLYELQFMNLNTTQECLE